MLTYSDSRQVNRHRNMNGPLSLLDARYPHGYGLLSSLAGYAAHYGGPFASLGLPTTVGSPYNFDYIGQNNGNLSFNMESLMSPQNGSPRHHHGSPTSSCSDKHGSLQSPGMFI